MTTDRGSVPSTTSASRVLAGISLVSVALFAAYSGVISVLLPMQVEALDADNKIAALAFVTSLSFAVTAFAQPLVGALSDRTRSRWGRRIPWMVAGAVVGGIALGLAGGAGSVAVLAAAWALAQFALNGTDIASTAYLVDRFPPQRRGSVSAVLGVAAIAGGVGGALLAGRLTAPVPVVYAVLAAGVLVAVLIFVVLVRDPPALAGTQGRTGARAFAREFRDAFRGHPDFVKVLVWRFCFTLAYGAVYGYLLYLLTDYAGVGKAHAGTLVGTVTAVGGVSVIIGVNIGGWLSDRLRRRIPFLLAAAALVGIGDVAAFVSPSVGGIFLLAGTFGAALGLSIACGLALGSEVISDPDRNAGRGLGILNFAGNVGQATAPLIGAAAVALSGGYRALFIVSVVAVVASCAVLMTVRSAR